LTEPGPRTLDVRVGSATNALTPVSAAERSLAATPGHWLGLAAVVLAALTADQLTKRIVSSLLHAPIESAREAGDDGTALRDLFRLP